MNWKSTVVLVILAAGAGVWLWKGDTVAPDFGRRVTPPEPAALAALEADFTPDTVTRVEVLHTGGESLVLEKGEKGWKQPGNWPLRVVEVNELVETLANLRTRFQPVALPEDADLATYGLAEAQKPLTVKVTAGGATYALKFGEPKASAGETTFTRSAFVRVNDAAEVLKLGPDVMPVLRRPAETYRRRQLFSNPERVKFAGAPSLGPTGMPQPGVPTAVKLPSLTVEEVRVTDKSVSFWGLTPWQSSGNFTLKRTGPTPAPTVTAQGADAVVQPDRLADVWALDAPVRDRIDPAKLQQVLAAIPELWVEEFTSSAKAGYTADRPAAIAKRFVVAVDPLAALVGLYPDPREELRQSKQSVGVRTKDGNTVTVKFGGIAKLTEREEMVSIPGPMGGPPRMFPRKVQTVHRYAQVEGNPQVFTVAGDKLDGLFAKAGDLVEANVARFAPDEVQAVTIATPGKPAVTLMRKKGNPKATKKEDKEDRWEIDAKPNPLLADMARVDDLINRLANFRGDSSTDLYSADPKAQGLDPATATAITVVVREKRPEGEPDEPARELKLYVGAPDFAKGKMPLQLAGWPRITLADDRIATGPPGAEVGWLTPKLFPERVSALFARPAVAYRGRKLLDTADAKLVALTVEGANGFSLKQEKVGERDAWKLATPLASDTDPVSVAGLLAQLSDLQATEFVAESAANPAEYGLDKPKLTVQLSFDNKRGYKLEVGGPRPGKPGEVFARLDGGNVFGLPVAVTDTLAAGPLALLPLQVWNVPLEKITGLEITRFDTATDSFVLAKDGTNWKLSGPFAAPVPFLNAQPMLSGLGVLGAAKYEALTAPDPAKFGFDKPLAKVKLTFDERPPGPVMIGSFTTKTVVIGGVTPGGFDRYAKLDEPTAPVFVLPAGYLFGVQTSPLALLDRNLLFLNFPAVMKIRIDTDKPEDAITLIRDEKKQDIWTAEGAAFAVDNRTASQLAIVFAPLPITRLAAYGDAVKWADYGLDKPAFTFTVTVGGDKPATHKVQMGKADPLGGRYVRVDDGKAVGVTYADAVPLLARTRMEFVDRTLFAFDPTTLTSFARTKGKEELELAPGVAVGWDVVKPAKMKADQPLMDELTDALSRLRAEKVVAFGKKADVFKQYGLEPPDATLTLTAGEKAEQKVLRVGRAVDPAKPDGDRYVAVEGAGPDAGVGILPGALANKLLAAPVSFRDRTIVKFVDADKLQLERGDRKATFTKVNGTWKVTAPITTEAEQAALDDLVNDLGKLRAGDWVAEKPADLKPFGLDKPEATWTVTNGDKVVLTLLIGKAAADGRVHATVANSGMVALLGKEQSAKVLAEYRARKPWVLDAFQADTIEIARGGKTFAILKRGAAWVDPVAPDDAISTPAVAELLGGLTALQVDRYAVDENGDPKLFGLDKPEVTVTVTFKDGSSRVLAIGNAVGGTNDKQRYAKVVDKNRTEVFVLSVADTARLMRDRAAYVQKK